MPDLPVSELPRFETEAVGITHNAGGFYFEPHDVPCPRTPCIILWLTPRVDSF
jgi:hypothetical protein